MERSLLAYQKFIASKKEKNFHLFQFVYCICLIRINKNNCESTTSEKKKENTIASSLLLLDNLFSFFYFKKKIKLNLIANVCQRIVICSLLSLHGVSKSKPLDPYHFRFFCISTNNNIEMRKCDLKNINLIIFQKKDQACIMFSKTFFVVVIVV